MIAAALLYLGKTVSLSLAQTSILVAAVLGGSMTSSLLAGVLSDWFGRRKMMMVAGLMFVVSVGLIVAAQGFTMLFLGRLLQGMSGGVIAVVVPLYLAECLGASYRGRGAAIFQWMLTLGIVVASVAGLLYTWQAEGAIRAAAGDAVLIRAAENHAWRGMFLAMIYPGMLFFAGSLFLVETPRWLFRKGRRAEALASLRQLGPEAEAQLQMREMEAVALKEAVGKAAGTGDPLLRRKYVVPFVLACTVLACNQATGINSILAFLVVILKQAGMSAAHATAGDVVVKGINCVMTVVAVLLVDRKGRRFLLRIGTGGIIVTLLAAGVLFRTFESQRVDVRLQAQAAVSGDRLHLPLDAVAGEGRTAGRAASLTVLYSYGSGDRVAAALSTDAGAAITIVPVEKDAGKPLAIRHAFYGPVAGEGTGWLITLCLGLFVSFFSVGPGVVVWLALSELMPTRIRSAGMGIALLLNQGVSTVIAALFLPVVGYFGYYAMFLFWAGCTTVYFLTATFFLPETKGKTLEEIERIFDKSLRLPAEAAG
ncbi:MAG TPA: MFS transporter [Acidobacteriaceae bacterium]